MSESELLRDKLRFHLAKVRDLMSGQMKDPKQFHYQGISDFILREGQFFQPRPLQNGMKYMDINHCYKNAFWTALQEGFAYAEGYAIGSSLGLPMLHAWNLDRDGFVVDRRGTRTVESTSVSFFLCLWFREKGVRSTPSLMIGRTATRY